MGDHSHPFPPPPLKPRSMVQFGDSLERASHFPIDPSLWFINLIYRNIGKRYGWFIFPVRTISVPCFLFIVKVINTMGFPDSSVGKGSTCKAGDPGSVPRSGRSAEEGICYPLQYSWASLVAQLVKNPPAMQETWVQSLGLMSCLYQTPNHVSSESG